MRWIARTVVAFGMVLALITPASASALGDELLQNGGFESGDFAGWGTADHPEPYEPLHVAGSGEPSPFGLFATAPDGTYGVVHAFDGGGTGTIDLWQEVEVPAGLGAELTFSLRIGWDLDRWCAGCDGARTLDVVVEPVGGGPASATSSVLTVAAGTSLTDSGNQQVSVDLSALSGQSVRIVLRATIPADFTGPARLQIDEASLITIELPPEGAPDDIPDATVTPGVVPSAAAASPATAQIANPSFTG